MNALIVFLCAATSATGAGHLSRCLALAGAYRKAGWRIEFIVTGDAFANMFGADNSWHVAAPERITGVLRTVAPHGCDILVIDDYERDENFESACRGVARQIFVLDDQSGRCHRCDVLIDAAADTARYRDLVGETTRILAGPKYALVRPDILKRRRAAIAARSGRKVTNILLSFGATDPAGLTLKALDALADSPLADKLLTAALSSHARDIEVIKSRCSARIRLLVDPDMGEVITDADLGLGAGGVGAFERAVLGLPGVVVAAADNQRGILHLLVGAGAALDGGGPDEGFAARIVGELMRLAADTGLRTDIGRAAASLVDGRAADRIHLACGAGTVIPTGETVRLRAAEFEDANWLLELQREPATRRFARDPTPPSQEQHMRWLASILDRGSSSLAIVEIDGAAVGMIRLDPSEPWATDRPRYEVSIAVGALYHGRGIGAAALRLIRALQPNATFDAFVLPQNQNSLRMFLRAGYIKDENGFYRSVPGVPRGAES